VKTSQAHYASHLGPVYAWMLGDLDSAFARAAAELADMDLPGRGDVHAVDLGAGLGLHAVSLAKRGYRVTAIDSCELLLEELRSRSAGLTVEVINGDLTEFARHVDRKVDVILCMGDTLTHLPASAAVLKLLDSVAAALVPDGLFIATFRDYVTRELRGDERFILVKRDEERVLTCFLEYGTDQVVVHDILTERRDNQWVQTVSSYPKLRLAPDWLLAELTQRGFKSRRETAPAGMVRVVGRKE
jgi:2-polyprenyl-3-methyl-5-hydroxy-6-metoxy-1,4-benzoquinol methylase